MRNTPAIANLRSKRLRLIPFYFGFLFCLLSSGAMAGTGFEVTGVGMLLCLSLALSIPVLHLNILLHRAIKRIDPSAGSSGTKQAVLSALVFTPFEAALVLPAINLSIAHRILRNWPKQPNKKGLGTA